MKKLFLMIVLLTGLAGSAWAYDFSATAPSGQTLYYTINGNNVTVTCPIPAENIFESWEGYSQPVGELTIPSSVTFEGTNYLVTTIGDYAFSDCTGLTTITIPNSVTTIGINAFVFCTGLTSITIPRSVTSIGVGAFQVCRGLTSLTIPNSVTTICNYVFHGCTGLTSITIPNSVTTIGDGVFADCTGLTSITIPNSVTTIGDDVFSNCTGLTSITIPNSVTTIGDDVFSNCTGLTSIIIPNSVTTIGWRPFDGCSGLTVYFNATNMNDYSVFSNCPALAAFIIGDNVQRIPASLCYGCTGLTSVTIGNSVTDIGSYAFYGCTGLTSVTIPNSVTTIGDGVFSNCTGLTSITIPNSVTTIGGGAFYNCTGLTKTNYTGTIEQWYNITFSSSNPIVYSRNLYLNDILLTHLVIPDGMETINGALSYDTCITSVTIPNSVTTIGNYAFAYCTGLTSVTIGNSVMTIGDNAFYNCTGLTKTNYTGTISQWCNIDFCSILGTDHDATNPIYYSHNLFINDIEVKNLVIPEGVQSLKCRVFSNCTGFISVTIPNSVTSIGRLAFQGCTGLTRTNYTGSIAQWCNIDFWGWNSSNPIWFSHNLYIDDVEVTDLIIAEGVTQIKPYAFRGCTGLTSVTIGNSVTTIEEAAFDDCTGLNSVIIGDTVTTIGDYAFYNCMELNSLTIGNSVTTIGYGTFYNCRGLTSLTIPNSVTYIGSSAFAVHRESGGSVAAVSIIRQNPVDSCMGLTSITIGSSVSEIGSYAFFGCCNLDTIFFNGPQPPTLGFEVFQEVSDNCVINVPCGAQAIYAARLQDYFYSFVEQGVQFSAGSDDESMGTVQILTAPTCTNPNAVLYAVPNSGYRFDHWSTGSTDNPYTLTVTGSMTVTGYFVEETEEFQFAAVSEDESKGMVQILTAPTGPNTNAVLYAVANEGYHFDHWSTGSTENPYVLTVTGSMTVTGYFESDGTTPTTTAPAIACVTVDQNNHNVVRWEPRDGTTPIRYNVYRQGLGGYSIVGYVNFTGVTEYSWVDDSSNPAAQTYSYKLSEVYADNSESDFSAAHTTMHLQINQGQGNTMNLSWTPYVGFEYDGYRIYHGTSANSMNLLTTLAAANTTYSDANGTPTTLYQIEVVPSSRSLIVSARSNISSEEAPSSYTLTVTSADPAMGTVLGGGSYPSGGQAIVEASPNSGYRFDHWSDGSTQASRIITVTGDATYIAYFASTQPEGIHDTEMGDLTLYPNPTTGIVTVRLNPETCNLTPEIWVYDVYGRMLSVVGTRCTTSLQTVQIDLSQYATGIYLVKLVNDGKVVATGKVVKQ